MAVQTPEMAIAKCLYYAHTEELLAKAFLVMITNSGLQYGENHAVDNGCETFANRAAQQNHESPLSNMCVTDIDLEDENDSEDDDLEHDDLATYNEQQLQYGDAVGYGAVYPENPDRDWVYRSHSDWPSKSRDFIELKRRERGFIAWRKLESERRVFYGDAEQGHANGDQYVGSAPRLSEEAEQHDAVELDRGGNAQYQQQNSIGLGHDGEMTNEDQDYIFRRQQSTEQQRFGEMTEGEYDKILEQQQQSLEDSQSMCSGSASQSDADEDQPYPQRNVCSNKLVHVHRMTREDYVLNQQQNRDRLFPPKPGEHHLDYIARIMKDNPELNPSEPECKDRWDRLEKPFMPAVGEFKAEYVRRMRDSRGGNGPSRAVGGMPDPEEIRWDVVEGACRPYAREGKDEYVRRMLAPWQRPDCQGQDVSGVVREAERRWRVYDAAGRSAE